MARIGVAGFLHETNTFAPSRAALNDFVAPDAWPGLLQGEELFSGLAGQNIPSAGFIAATQSAHRIVPLIWASANPSGPVTRDAYESIWQQFAERLRASGPLDALFLDLHGAMVCEHLDDGEGEWLMRTRALIGDDVAILMTLDFHANVSARMVELSDVIAVYRSYPHVDMAATGARITHYLPALLRGERWHKQHVALPFLIPLPWQASIIEPMQSILEELQRDDDRFITKEFSAGFPLADVYDSGPSLIAYSRRDESSAVENWRQMVMEKRQQFSGELCSITAAIERIKNHRDAKPLIFAETQDNPGGGGDGDGVAFVHALKNADVRDGCVALIADAECAKYAHHVGVGACFSMPLGGKKNHRSGPPLTGPFIVRALADGKFLGSGPFYGGCHMDLGLMARVDYHGIQLLISSRNQQAADQAMLRVLGIEPATQTFLVLKSSVHFRADFSRVSDAIYLLDTPGENVADLQKLTYRKLRSGVTLLD